VPGANQALSKGEVLVTSPARLPRVALALLCGLALAALGAAPAPAATLFSSATQAIDITPGTGDPTQTGRLERTPPASSCAAPQTPTAQAGDTATHHFDSFGFFNLTNESQCITVTIDPQSCTGATAGIDRLQSAAYNGLHNLADPTANYLADIGDSPTTPTPYSYNTASQAVSVVTVNEVGSEVGCSSYGITIVSDKPWATNAPAIAGGAVTGEALARTPGAWVGAPVLTYQWHRCDAAGANCAGIAGATNAGYVPTDADVGSTLRVREIGTTAGRSASVYSAPTQLVQSGRPRPAYTRTQTAGAAIAPGTTLLPGSQADDAAIDFALPFPVTLSGIDYPSAKISTNGIIQFQSSTDTFVNDGLPVTNMGPLIAPFWDDLVLTRGNEGIFTSVTGAAPNRVLHIEWRGNLFPETPPLTTPPTDPVDFEARIGENGTISFVYSVVSYPSPTTGPTIGLQAAAAAPLFDQFAFNTNAVTAGTEIDYTPSRASISGTARQGLALTGGAPAFVGRATIMTANQWLACNAAGANCAAIAGATGPTFTPTAAQVSKRIRFQVTGTNGSGSTPIVSPPSDVVRDTTRPVISALSMTNKVFKKGTTIRYTLSEAAKARFTIERALSGRKSGKKCVKPSKTLSKKKKCTRYSAVGTLTRSKAVAGANKLAFTGRIDRKKLAPGNYRITLRATDAAGNVSKPRTTTFRIVKK
jgi:hypothetical protein